MATTLKQTITGTGINQEDLVAWMTNATAVVNELQADHAVFTALVNELKDDIDATAAAVDAVLDKLDADGGVTDTDYGSTHGVGGSGAALPAAGVAAADAATLTNSTALTLSKG